MSDADLIKGATLNATKFGVPALLGGSFAAALIGAKQFAEAQIDLRVTIAAFALVAVGVVAAATVAIADYIARAYVTAVELRASNKASAQDTDSKTQTIARLNPVEMREIPVLVVTPDKSEQPREILVMTMNGHSGN